MRYLLSLLVLTLAACGNEPPPEKPWLPRFDTPEHATEAYLRGYETANVELGTMATVPAERATHGRFLRARIDHSRKRNLQWSIEVEEGSAEHGADYARIKVFYRLYDEEGNPADVLADDGRVIKDAWSWLVFLRQPDGSWRMSPSRTAELMELDRKKRAAAD